MKLVLSTLVNVALGLFLVAGAYYGMNRPALSAASPDPVAEYERQIQRGVLERVTALNNLGKVQVLAMIEYQNALTQDRKQVGTMRDAARASVLSADLAGFLRTVDAAKADQQALDLAREKFGGRKAEVTRWRRKIMAWDFERFAVPAAVRHPATSRMAGHAPAAKARPRQETPDTAPTQARPAPNPATASTDTHARPNKDKKTSRPANPPMTARDVGNIRLTNEQAARLYLGIFGLKLPN